MNNGIIAPRVFSLTVQLGADSLSAFGLPTTALKVMNPVILGTNGNIAAIDTATGSELWRTSLKTGGLISSTNHQDVSVLLKDGMVLAGCCGHLFCLDAATGNILWHNPLTGLGHNDISLAMEGVAVQFMTKVERSS